MKDTIIRLCIHHRFYMPEACKTLAGGVAALNHRLMADNRPAYDDGSEVTLLRLTTSMLATRTLHPKAGDRPNA
jgi:hypothetical protein